MVRLLPSLAGAMLLAPALLHSTAALSGESQPRNVGAHERAKIDGLGSAFQSSATGDFVSVYCIDGYKFILAGDRKSPGKPTLVQAMEIRKGKALPAICKNR